MKYCSFCGCYIPDDWDNCPACGKENYTPELIYYNRTIDIVEGYDCFMERFEDGE